MAQLAVQAAIRDFRWSWAMNNRELATFILLVAGVLVLVWDHGMRPAGASGGP